MQCVVYANDVIERVALRLATVFAACLTPIVFVEVVARYGFRYSFVWSEEAAILCFQWITFLGGAVALRHGRHFVVDLLPDIREASYAGIIRRAGIQIAQLTFGLILAVYGAQYAFLSLKRYSYALGIPIIHVTSAIPVAGLVMVAFSVEGLLLAILRHPYRRPGGQV